MIVNKKSKTKKTFGTVLIIMLTTSYVAGFLLASNRIISSEIILSNNIIFFSYDKPLLYGFIFAFEMTSAAISLFIGKLILAYFFKKEFLFLVVGVFLNFCALGLLYLAFFNNTNNETGHVVTFSLFGLIILFFGIAMILTHFKKKKHNHN